MLNKIEVFFYFLTFLKWFYIILLTFFQNLSATDLYYKFTQDKKFKSSSSNYYENK